ncbi:MAG TPA: ATP-binding protein [Cellvibrionaceae bacterium]
MRYYRDLPIQRKISSIVALGMASVTVLTVLYFFIFDIENLKRDLGEEIRVLARITAARSAAAVAFGDATNATENLKTLELRSSIQNACIYDQGHQLFAQYRRAQSHFEPCATSFDPQLNPSHVEMHDRIELAESIVRKNQHLGYVQVTADLSTIVERKRAWILTSALVILLAPFITYLMTLRLKRSVVDPILDLAGVMDEVRSSNNLGLRAQVLGQDEVGSLGESFNEMLGIIETNNRDLEHLYRVSVEKSAEAEAAAASLHIRNQQIKDLFGGAAHDLRQPLQAMTIFVQTLGRKIDNPEQLLIVDKLRQATQNLSGLFKEVLDVARYEFDQQVAATQPIAIKPLLNKLFLEFEALAQEKSLRLHFFTPDNKILAHAILLERIIRNLLSNAIRYTDKGGVLLGCRKRGNNLAIEVWDTGRGIPAHQQEQIFHKYMQVSEDDREVRGGFGMGLAIVKQFVDSLGYTLSVHSTPGRGTVFRLLVPLVNSGRRQPRISSRPNLSLRPNLMSPNTATLPAAQLNVADMRERKELRILLLDDHDDVRWGIRQHLEEWGFAVDDFASEQKAAAFLSAGGRKPDLIISDFELGPDNTGIQAIIQLRKQLNETIPAFIVTGADDSEIWQAITDSGFYAVSKPFKPARLRALINHLLVVQH